MALCTCNSLKHSVITIGNWEGCPLQGGGHTNFMILKCKKCNGILGFPNENLKIALENGTEETKVKLAEIIGN